MSFTSLSFAVFFPVVTAGYFLMPKRYQWVFLLIASYYFYASHHPAYVLLLLFTTLVTYGAGLAMDRTSDTKKKRLTLLLSIVLTVGLLFLFKYFNFFTESFASASRFFDLPIDPWTLKILLPIGISFYTFQSLGYVIDVYKGKRSAEKHFGYYALFVSFFPQLLSGPIERADRMLPQFRKAHSFEYEATVSGLKLMAWGFFKKLVIADSAALVVDKLYDDPVNASALGLLLATYLFAYQIFCDFSAYTDIARGTARILGINLMENFHRPYAATSIGDFWRRWHISLSSWFRDYIYIPLGGSRVPLIRQSFNILIVFLLSGLWHGADWTFVIWGLLHGIFLVLSLLTGNVRKKFTHWIRLDAFPKLHQALQILFTFHLVLFSWIFFRANSIDDAVLILNKIAGLFVSGVSTNLSVLQEMLGNIVLDRTELSLLVVAILTLEISQLISSERFEKNSLWIRWPLYYVLLLVIFVFGRFGNHTFIYSQF